MGKILGSAAVLSIALTGLFAPSASAAMPLCEGAGAPQVLYSIDGKLESVIVGNTALYGATGGALFARGLAGERFAVRNSGARAVVEGCGDHGCEYMTGGAVVVLGPTGRNFAAGMSGGVAYVLDKDQTFRARLNPEMVELEPLVDESDLYLVYGLIEDHVRLTGSSVGRRLLDNWELMVPRFVKVMPIDYRRVLQARRAAARPRLPTVPPGPLAGLEVR